SWSTCAAQRAQTALAEQFVDRRTHELGDALGRLVAEERVSAHQPEHHRPNRAGHPNAILERDRRVRHHTPEALLDVLVRLAMSFGIGELLERALVPLVNEEEVAVREHVVDEP